VQHNGIRARRFVEADLKVHYPSLTIGNNQQQTPPEITNMGHRFLHGHALDRQLHVIHCVLGQRGHGHVALFRKGEKTVSPCALG
jgi:hypothetical protein